MLNIETNLRRALRTAIPAPIRARLREIINRLVVPGYSNAPIRRPLTKYIVDGATVAQWSLDHQQPHGVVLESCYVPHYLLARAVLSVCKVQSWCDLGSGVGSLPLAVARLGINDVLAIEGSDTALRSGLVRFPHSNYFVADVTEHITVKFVDGIPASFGLVSALELFEHIPEDRLDCLFVNIRRMNPKILLLSVGLQPDPPYHVNLKTMRQWMQRITEALQGSVYDDDLSQKVFEGTRRHPRFQNGYPTNCFPDNRNLLVFVRRQ